MNDHGNDEFLMSRICLGSQECMEQLVRRYADAVLRFLLRYERNRDTAEELFQDVFLAVWEKRKQFNFNKTFRPWLYTIMLNKIYERHRHRSFRLTNDIVELPEMLTPIEDNEPAAIAITTEHQTMIQHAITQLPPRQQLVLTLRIWDDLSYAQIARIINRRESGTRSIMRDALVNLRCHLETHMK